MQYSKRLLWGTAAAAILLTIAAEFWGFNRVSLVDPLAATVNRGLLIASLLTLTTFIHFGINQSQKIVLDATEIERQRSNLSAQKDALRQSEENYRMLLDGIQSYAIFMMDPQGRIISWNAGAELIKGYRADEIIGHNFSCFFPPEDIERGRPEEILRITAESGWHEEQGMRLRKDGSRFFANVTFRTLRDTAGNLRGFSEFSHDLSESKESGAKYRALLEAAPDAMVGVNQAGEIVLLNLQAEKQFGYHRDELVGQKVTNIIPTAALRRVLFQSRPAPRSGRGGYPVRYRFQIRSNFRLSSSLCSLQWKW
jgi:PAS domain S-box-containing protein